MTPADKITFGTGDIEPFGPCLPENWAARIWLELSRRISEYAGQGDPLNTTERELYTALTGRLTVSSVIMGGTIEEKPNV